MSLVLIRIGRDTVDGWTGARIALAFDATASAFEVSFAATAPDPRAEAITARCIRAARARETMTLELAGVTAITGTIERYDDSSDARSHKIKVAGRAATARLLTSAAGSVRQWRQKPFEVVAQDIAGAAGLAVEFAGDVGGPVDFAIRFGETGHDAIRRLCALRGFLVGCSEGGALRIIATWSRGDQIEIRAGRDAVERTAYRLDYSERAVASVVSPAAPGSIARSAGAIVVGRGPERPPGAAATAKPDYTVSLGVGAPRQIAAKTAPQSYPEAAPPPTSIRTQRQAADDLGVMGSAKAEAQRRAGKTAQYDLVLPNWLKAGGGIWAPGDRIRIVDPGRGLDLAWAVDTATYIYGDGPTTVELGCVPPEALKAKAATPAAGAPEAAAIIRQDKVRIK